MKNVMVILIMFQFIACQSNQENLDKDYPIVHMVFLNIKDDVMENDRKNFIDAIEALSEINVVHNLSYGSYKDLRDPRSLKEYDMLIQMQFASERDYLIYQKEERHLALKQMGGLLLAGPPHTYHFVLE